MEPHRTTSSCDAISFFGRESIPIFLRSKGFQTRSNEKFVDRCSRPSFICLAGEDKFKNKYHRQFLLPFLTSLARLARGSCPHNPDRTAELHAALLGVGGQCGGQRVTDLVADFFVSIVQKGGDRSDLQSEREGFFLAGRAAHAELRCIGFDVDFRKTGRLEELFHLLMVGEGKRT
jgi:hypothetical protein